MKTLNALNRTDDGFLADDAGEPLALFRGTVAGEDDIGGTCPVTGRRLDVMWFTSCPENAEFFADGEVQRCHIRLANPIVFEEEQPCRLGPGPYVSSLNDDDMAQHDGVIWRDIVDGCTPSDIYAVFPRDGSIAHAVAFVGRKTYDEDGEASWTGDLGTGWRTP